MKSFIKINVDANAPIFLHLDPDNFGQVFANMNSENQAQVLQAIAASMKKFPVQWDHIAIEMEKPEYSDAVSVWRGFIATIGAS